GRRWVNAVYTPTVDAAGVPDGWVAVVIDVTARKEMEEALRKQNERLRLLWEAAAGLLSTDEPGVMMRGLFCKPAQHFGIDTYFNYMVDEAGDALRLESCVGVPEEAARSVTRLEFGQAICGSVALHRRPVVATHVQQSDDPGAQLIRSFGV